MNTRKYWIKKMSATGKFKGSEFGYTEPTATNVAKMTPWEYFIHKTFIWKGGWGFWETVAEVLEGLKTGLIALGMLFILPFYPLIMLYVSITKPAKTRKYVEINTPSVPSGNFR